MKINITDRYMPLTSLTLEGPDHANMASLSIGEEAKLVFCRVSLSEEALRSFSRAALAMADDLRDRKSQEQARKGENS